MIASTGRKNKLGKTSVTSTTTKKILKLSGTENELKNRHLKPGCMTQVSYYFVKTYNNFMCHTIPDNFYTGIYIVATLN
jgi:hypothetical protein